ncbi:putative CBL-interacting protein kinase 13 [Miscanthus floridulus]|uniref:putative CBL-interacting protein kinase 13 n=1 Tax=Miscanthus floridulus TaxID=154761 RepID=UPI00345A4727
MVRTMVGKGGSNGSGGGGGRESKKPALLLGRYEVGKLLGQGNFAKVYHARNVRTGEEVAIKVMEKEKIFKSGLMAHIKREIAVLRRVRHPHIVQLYEVMATKLRIYFVMEYVRGGELFARVARGRLREADARCYFQQLVSSVAFCHARGVYHRDIKPENLLLDDAGDLKVSDFGLSAVADQMRHDGLFHTFCGTPAYVAPEVLSRRGYAAAKADLWSCGVVLFVLAAGYLPFQDRNLMAMYRKIHRGEFRCPKWFSPELTRLLRRVLDTNPQRRATADEIMDDEWFKVGFRRFSFRIEDDRSFTCFDLDDDGVDASTSPPEPDTPRADAAPRKPRKGSAAGLTSCASAPSLLQLESRSGLGGSSRRRSSLNAFDIISFSRGFDLSGLFEDGEGGGVPEQPPHPAPARFVSAAPVEQILATLEGAASAAGMVVRERDDGSISMEGTREGEHGALAVAAEIYELTPELLVVEVRRKSGGAAEYEEFFRAQLKPSLRDLVCDEPTLLQSGESSRSL